MTYKFTLPVQPKLPLPPPFRPVLEGVEVQSGPNKRRTQKVEARRSIDHSSFTSRRGIEEGGKEKPCEVKVP